MKILAVIGSHKGRGAGYSLVKMIEEKIRSEGDVDFDYLFLKDANLKQCAGCYVCLAKGEDKCPLRDDRAAIEQKLLAVDGVILSTVATMIKALMGFGLTMMKDLHPGDAPWPAARRNQQPQQGRACNEEKIRRFDFRYLDSSVRCHERVRPVDPCFLPGEERLRLLPCSR